MEISVNCKDNILIGMLCYSTHPLILLFCKCNGTLIRYHHSRIESELYNSGSPIFGFALEQTLLQSPHLVGQHFAVDSVIPAGWLSPKVSGVFAFHGICELEANLKSVLEI
jgi:hypothetical protein